MQLRTRLLAVAAVLTAAVIPASAGRAVLIGESRSVYRLTELFTASPIVGTLYLCEGDLALQDGGCPAGHPWSDSVYFTSPGPNRMTIYYESDVEQTGDIDYDDLDLADFGLPIYVMPPGFATMSIGEAGGPSVYYERVLYTPTAGQPGYAESDNFTFAIFGDTPETGPLPAVLSRIARGRLAAAAPAIAVCTAAGWLTIGQPPRADFSLHSSRPIR